MSNFVRIVKSSDNSSEGQWITVNGSHLLDRDGQSKDDAVKDKIKRDRGQGSSKPEEDSDKAKKAKDKLDKAEAALHSAEDGSGALTARQSHRLWSDIHEARREYDKLKDTLVSHVGEQVSKPVMDRARFELASARSDARASDDPKAKDKIKDLDKAEDQLKRGNTSGAVRTIERISQEKPFVREVKPDKAKDEAQLSSIRERTLQRTFEQATRPLRARLSYGDKVLALLPSGRLGHGVLSGGNKDSGFEIILPDGKKVTVPKEKLRMPKVGGHRTRDT